MNNKTSPVPCCLSRWDEMSVGTCPVFIPWTKKWSDVVTRLRSKRIDRLLAWGDSTGEGRCRFESAADGVQIANRSSNHLASQLLTLFSSVIKPLAEGHSQLYAGEEAFFSSGRKRFDFNACIDLRDCTDIRMVVHVSAACGLVYMLNVTGHLVVGRAPQAVSEEATA